MSILKVAVTMSLMDAQVNLHTRIVRKCMDYISN